MTPSPRSARGEASILHVDMDAFFVSVELLRDPSLRGRPVVVGGTGDRGVVAAASYEARAYGIESAMPSARARRLCPSAVFVAGSHARYGEVSARVMEIFRSFTPLVEPISLDEAFLDVATVLRLHGRPAEIAAAIRERVYDQEGLTCSVGVATTKLVAKLASEAAKPKASRTGPVPGLGVKVVDPGSELEFLHPLPVQVLWGVGPATLERLGRLGVRTIGDLAALGEEAVVGALGPGVGRHLHRLSYAEDDRSVVPEQRPKSIGHEETFAHDHHRHESLEREVVRLSDGVASRLRQHRLAGRTVVLKVRFHDFRTITRSWTLPSSVDSGPAIARAAKAMLGSLDPSPGVRLLGVSVSGLVDDAARQLSLEELGARSWDDANAAVDDIRRRFGADAIGPAALGDPDGIAVKRRGDQQWGPGADGG